MTQFKTQDSIEATIVLMGVWIWKFGEFLYKHSRSADAAHPERFGYIVSFDVPFFVTIGLSLMFALRTLERWYQAR
jgi:hypothetical protein